MQHTVYKLKSDAEKKLHLNVSPTIIVEKS